MLDAVKKTKSKKAPGPGEVTAEMLMAAVRIDKTKLFNIFNKLLSAGEFPIKWEKSITMYAMKRIIGG